MPNTDVQKQKDQGTAVPSIFAKEKTYGEKMYHRIFDVGLNFWVNLVTSAAFTFWVTHSTKPVWGPETWLGKTGWGKKLNAEGITNFGHLHEKGVLKLKDRLTFLPTDELRTKRADSIMNVFTLQLPGHFIMIPSLWLGAKVKPAIVKYFDRKHYGDAAMETEEMKARHHAVDVEERPTLAGAVVGRVGAMVINMSAGALIGSESNLINKVGHKTNIEPMKRFAGIDPVAGKIGEHVGNIAQEVAPTSIAKANAAFARNGYTGNVKQFSRFLAQDVMYTIFTSSTVHPVVNFMRKYIPGMTYKPVVKPEAPAMTPAPKPEPMAIEAQTEPTAEPKHHAHTTHHHEHTQHPARPSHKVSHSHHESTITKREHSLATSGA